MPDAIADASEVLMHFSLLLVDGTVVDSSREVEPLSFVLGDGTLEAGLEALLHGLHAGDRAQFNLAPGQAFGLPDPASVHQMSRAEFPADLSLQAGAVVEFTTPRGDSVPGTVIKLDGDSVTVDFNHPLAGRDLRFEVEILSVNTPESADGC